MVQFPPMRWAPLILFMIVPWTRGEDLIVQLPAGTHISAASAKSASTTVSGTTAADSVHFKLQPSVKYDITLQTADGRVEQGVDSGWYDSERPDPTAAPIDDDDRQQIQAILTDIKSFYDRTEAIATWGNHDRAVLLVQRIRESKFHSDKGGEAIWRVELWYFKNEAGGWAKVSQQDRVLRRERFDSSDEMKKTIGQIAWRPELGGVQLETGKTKSITFDPKLKPENTSSTSGSASQKGEN